MSKDAVRIYASLLRGQLEGDEALRASQQMLEMVMNSIPQAIFWKDRSLNYLGCNKIFADLAGMEPSELIGKTDLETPWASHEAVGYRHWDNLVMESGKPQYSILEQMHRDDGQVRWLETNKVPLFDLDGEVIGVLGTFEDVTERMAAESQLKLSLAEMDEQVRERTKELSEAQKTLQNEIATRARLQQEEREQRVYAEALQDTAGAITRSLDTDDVLEQVLVGLQRVMRHDLGAVLMVDEEDWLSLAHYRTAPDFELRHPDPEDEELSRLLRDRGDTEPVVLEGEVGIGRASRSVLVAPIGLAGQLLGYLVAESATAGEFSDQHAERIRVLADQAAIAISNAGLLRTAAVLAAAEERQRLARDLHDAISQTLWTAGLVAESIAGDASLSDDAATKAESLVALTQGALAEMRTLLLELRPDAVEEASLDQLIVQLANAFESKKMLKVICDVESIDALAPDAKLALYRVGQEALNNAARHSGATTVSITLSQRKDDIELAVADNGRGFDPTSASTGHLGLRIMRERVAKVGGALDIESSEDGSSVRAVVPVEAAS